MKVQSPPVLLPEPELHLLTTWEDADRRRRTVWAASGSLLANLFFVIAATLVVEYAPAPVLPNLEAVDVSKAVPLIAPPDTLTQTAPNRTKVAKELKLENLMAQPEVKPQPKVFSLPPAPPRGRGAVPQVPVLEPGQVLPPVALAQGPPPMQGTTPNLPGPPAERAPQIQSEEKPKLAFETPGAPSATPGGTGRIPAPKTSVTEAIQSASRPGGAGLTVGDIGVDYDGGIGRSLGQPGAPGKQASSLELLSDPMGVDFKPYLIQVLTAVRRNWFAVIPESARLGRRGKVLIQFVIDRSGAVPKLVIAMPSGTDALDRAAVAGISASNPFPPLPPAYRGPQIRLQLAFFYNVPTR
jgi:TonB family protein